MFWLEMDSKDPLDGDDLAESLAAGFSISSDPLSTDSPHPRFSAYKNRGCDAANIQEKRRFQFLEEQKKSVMNNHVMG